MNPATTGLSISATLFCLVVWFTCADAQSAVWWKLYQDSGKIYYDLGQYDKAEEWFSKALKEAEQFSDEDARLVTSLQSLADFYVAQKKYTQAESLIRRLLAIWERGPESSNPGPAELKEKYRRIILIESARVESIRAEQSLKELENRYGRDHPQVAAALLKLTNFYLAQSKGIDALVRRLAEIREKVGPDPSGLVPGPNELEKLARANPEWESPPYPIYAHIELIRLKESALKREKPWDLEDPDLESFLKNYLADLRVLNREAEMRQVENRLRAIYATRSIESIAQSLDEYAVRLRETNRLAEAKHVEIRAKEVRASKGIAKAAKYSLVLPKRVKSVGWEYEVMWVRTLGVVKGVIERFRPNGIFLVTGFKVFNGTDRMVKLKNTDFELMDSRKTKYPVASDLFQDIKYRVGGIDYPGVFMGIDVNYDSKKESFVVFDVPLNARGLEFRFKKGNTRLYLGDLIDLLSLAER